MNSNRFEVLVRELKILRVRPRFGRSIRATVHPRDLCVHLHISHRVNAKSDANQSYNPHRLFVDPIRPHTDLALAQVASWIGLCCKVAIEFLWKRYHELSFGKAHWKLERVFLSIDGHIL